jgi:hypothetical protein
LRSSGAKDLIIVLASIADSERNGNPPKVLRFCTLIKGGMEREK